MKNCYIITFELNNPGINEQKLIEEIKSSNFWAKLNSNTFLTLTEKNAILLRDTLTIQLKEGDKLYVGALTNSAAWVGLGDEVSKWILSNQK